MYTFRVIARYCLLLLLFSFRFFFFFWFRADQRTPGGQCFLVVVGLKNEEGGGGRVYVCVRIFNVNDDDYIANE